MTRISAPSRSSFRNLGSDHPTASGNNASSFAALPLPRWWSLWVGLYSLAVLGIGFIAMITPGFSRTELTVDQELSRHHDGVATVLAMMINYVFSPAGGLIIIAAVCLYLSLVRKSVVDAFGFGGVAAAGWMSSQLFKVIVDRPRPDPSLLFDPLAPETGFNSFPSGHVALAVGLGWAFYFLARRTRWSQLAVWAGILVPLIVALSRLYIGVHYPTDVTASFLAATAAVFLFAGVWNRYNGQLLNRIFGRPEGTGPLRFPTSTSR